MRKENGSVVEPWGKYTPPAVTQRVGELNQTHLSSW